jgi:diacylglycerol kinase (ATP)
MKHIKTEIIKEIKRIMLAFGYSFAGLRAAWGSEGAFRLEVVVATIAIPLSLRLSHIPSERALLIGSIILVLIVELLNTAVEAAINRISREIHPLSKIAKDVASGAVFLSIFNAFIIWTVILWN